MFTWVTFTIIKVIFTVISLHLLKYDLMLPLGTLGPDLQLRYEDRFSLYCNVQISPVEASTSLIHCCFTSKGNPYFFFLQTNLRADQYSTN